jgi:hypothetical protein
MPLRRAQKHNFILYHYEINCIYLFYKHVAEFDRGPLRQFPGRPPETHETLSRDAVS